MTEDQLKRGATLKKRMDESCEYFSELAEMRPPDVLIHEFFINSDDRKTQIARKLLSELGRIIQAEYDADKTEFDAL